MQARLKSCAARSRQNEWPAAAAAAAPADYHLPVRRDESVEASAEPLQQLQWRTGTKVAW
ncbi:MAG: hypothetical protein IVW55_16775 [Chloroflexi bacterium]|nr:hypothetical protein [Chloroflexota bacterium]